MLSRGMVGLVFGLAIAALMSGGCASSSKPVAAGSPEQDMQAYMVAGQPGAMHQWLAQGAGAWNTKYTMWMAPNAPPMETTGTATTRMIMDGRFAETAVTSTIPEMGTMQGTSIIGYDNVQKKFIGTWIDNHGSGMMQGVGTMSDDKKRIDWVYNYSCPITKSQRTMRETHMHPDNNTMIIESFARDPRTNVEYQVMRMEAKRAI